jgi:hypothetical protein
MKLALTLAAALFAVAPSALGRGNLSPSTLGVGLICGAEDATAATGGAATGLMRPGFGNAAVEVDTANPEARAWFLQAVNQYHAFAHDEQRAAFARAAAADPACSVCASGVAISLGSTLNTTMTADERVQARAAADRALALARTDRDRRLAAALQLRYAEADPPGGREMAFGKALDAVLADHPRDDLIASLAAHALIIPARQQNYAGVPRAIEILEGMLARRPDDTAAIHYYIHATEFAGKAPLALKGAEKLADLAPGSGHLVHMGTHTLMRVGRYETVALKNAQALKVDVESQPTLPATGSLAQRYYLHNYLFGLGGALMAGDGALALKYAEHQPKAFAATTPQNRAASLARSPASRPTGRSPSLR